MLTYNADSRAFVLYTDNMNLGSQMALAMDTGYTGRGYRFFTGRKQRGRFVPHYNPYAVLCAYDQADEKAGVELLDLWLQYQKSFATDTAEQFPVPDGLAYLPYQRAGIEYALERKHCMIADEPGLGKTIQALGIANASGARRIIVVCPASLRLQWQRQCRLWLIRPHTSQAVLNSRQPINPGAEVLLLSYEMARAAPVLGQVLQRQWDLLVVDESHYLKTPTAARTRMILGSDKELGLAGVCKRVVALTGTPMPNRPKECYTMARALDWESIDNMSASAFEDRYNPSRTLENGFKLESTNNLSELHARLRIRFMIRRNKAAVLTDLPAKRYELAYIEPTAEIRRIIAAERLLDIDTGQMEGLNAEIWGQVSTLRREMGVAKVGRAVDHVRTLLDGGVDKVVLFAYHREVVSSLAREFGDEAVAVHGSVLPRDREAAKKAFVENPKVKVFIGQLTAAGTGVDGLQEVCDRAVFVEASWTPGENEQCVDRLHRIGQKSSVLAQFLVAPGSLDERIIGKAIEKYHVIDRVLDRRLLSE